ncbi:MAG: multiheme c-type cytochrome, partial [Gammaproteobacteria bacterium]|nr:multiheme c-type cytochrome [Gammaproteobacteria bacterium]
MKEHVALHHHSNTVSNLLHDYTMFVNTAARVFIPILMGVLLISLSQPLFGDDYVGRSQCVNCHEEQVSQWQGSHHDLAMQPATPETVLGNFDNATYSHFGVISKFYRRDGQFYVRTDGPDGTLIEYKVKYTFGISPLQQYLVEFPNGKLQGLHIAWDSRPETQGGQHWFHLYPDENITHDDPLHWTGPSQNWNFMCADCHSTGLVKNYDLDTRSYQTTWSEIDVSCEACHGPGTQHVQWAQREDRDSIDNGLKVMLNERAEWSINQQTGLAKRVSKPSPMLQVETCGRCHARRSPLDKDYQHGRSLLHTHRIQTLQEDLYFPDGQIKDEVYVYGSFIQSKMYTKGVVCSDCHEPHSLQLRAEGNAVCASCHLQSTFDTEQHHFHKAGTDGAQCVNCHMPSRTYMVIDERRDHSFRIPRPDLSDQLGTPDVCTSCHQGRTPDWAASVIKTQWGGQAAERPHFGVAIHAGQNGALDAENQLMALAQNPNQPSIARASAVQLLQNYISPLSLPTIQAL